MGRAETIIGPLGNIKTPRAFHNDTAQALPLQRGVDHLAVDKISNGVKKALQDPAVTKRIQDTGSLVVANTPEEFAVQIKAEFEVYKKVVDQQNLKLD